MQSVKRTAQFRSHFRRVKRGAHDSHLDETLLGALELLVADAPLPDRYVDHPMKGRYADCRDCHLRPDLVLVYRKRGSDALELDRIGSRGNSGGDQWTASPILLSGRRDPFRTCRRMLA